MKTPFLIIVCLCSSINAVSAEDSSGLKISSPDGNVFMQEDKTSSFNKPGNEVKQITPQDYASMGIPVTEDGRIVPLIQPETGPVLHQGSRLQAYTEPGVVALPYYGYGGWPYSYSYPATRRLPNGAYVPPLQGFGGFSGISGSIGPIGFSLGSVGTPFGYSPTYTGYGVPYGVAGYGAPIGGYGFPVGGYRYGLPLAGGYGYGIPISVSGYGMPIGGYGYGVPTFGGARSFAAPPGSLTRGLRWLGR